MNEYICLGLGPTKCVSKQAVRYLTAEVQQNTCPEIIFIIHIDLILYPLCYTT